MTDKTKIIGGVAAALLIGAAFGRYTLPSKVVTVEKTVYKDKIITKLVKDTTSDKKNNTITIKVETIKPDGTRTIETKTINKDETLVVDHSTKNTEHDKTQISQTETSTTYNTQSLIISFGVDSSTDKFPNLGYGATVQKRIIGPFYLGVFGYTDKIFGINLGFSL